MQKAAPRLLIAGTNSGCGKTTVTCAILQALVDGGVSVAAAKCGPDYIDPMFHREIIGAKSSNLDPFFFDDDTQMAKAGINKTILASLGGEVHCFMSDPDVAQEARSRGVTRAFVSMEKAAALEKPCIFAIGNAPTALLSLEQLMEEGKAAPALIIGVPVGFVNVEISKERIIEKARAPYIVARGRKGGSNVAAAICNALLYQIRR